MAKRGLAPKLTFLCAKCRYDLTGVARDICPACGTTFDRVELLERMGRDPAVWRKIAVILWVAPLAVIGFTLAAHLLSTSPSDEVRHVVLMVIFAVGAAAPIACTRLVFSEVVIRNRHWAQDSQSKLVLAAAIFTVLAVLEAAFMVAAYVTCYLIFVFPQR